MRVQILDFVDGARAARGLAVIIDVFRAFSLEPYAAAAGARLLPVAEPEHALELKRRHPDWLVAGERNARRLPGFDYGNSPHEITSRPLKGVTVVHTTHAGTQGLVNAHGADAVLTAAHCVFRRDGNGGGSFYSRLDFAAGKFPFTGETFAFRPLRQ